MRDEYLISRLIGLLSRNPVYIYIWKLVLTESCILRVTGNSYIGHFQFTVKLMQHSFFSTVICQANINIQSLTFERLSLPIAHQSCHSTQTRPRRVMASVTHTHVHSHLICRSFFFPSTLEHRQLDKTLFKRQQTHTQ